MMGLYNIDKLSIIFDKRANDFIVKYPRKSDGNLAMHHILDDVLKHVMPSKKEAPYNFEVFNFIKELEKRGYDTKTLKFSIELKKAINR